MKVLILGCGGFIGSHLIDTLLKKGGYEITGYDLTDYKIEEHLNRFTFVRENVYHDLKALARVIAEHDVVIFLASICNPSLYMKKPLETIESNFTKPKEIVDICSALGVWFIEFSTCEVYGRTISSYVRDNYERLSLYIQDENFTPSVLGPHHSFRWSYAGAKMLMDRYLHAHHVERNLPYTIIRPYNFFGSRMDYLPEVDGLGVPRVLASFMHSLIYEKPLLCVDGGSQRRTITYITDAMSGVVKILENFERANGQVFNIANPANEVSIRELAIHIRNIFADYMERPDLLDLPIESVPSSKFYGLGYEDCDRRVPNIDRIMSLGWMPTHDTRETIFKTVRAFLDFYKISPEKRDAIFHHSV